MKRRTFLRSAALTPALGIKAATAQEARAAEPTADKLLALGGVQPLSMAISQVLDELGDRLACRTSPKTAEELSERRREVRQALLHSLGLHPLPPRTPLNARLLGRTERRGYSVERVVFESRPNFFIPANVYVPDKLRGRAPGVVCPIGHWVTTGKENPTHVQSRCIGLARRGYVTLTYDAIGQGERLVPGNHHSLGFTSFLLGSCNMGWLVWDSMRAVDYLQTRSDVDGDRIAITGASGGGANSFYTAAVDERIRVSVPVVFVCSYLDWFRYGGNTCICDHLPGFQGRYEEADVITLIAPRPLLILNSYADSGYPVSGTRRTFEAAQKIYQLADAARSVDYREFQTRHGFLQPEREAMYGWLDYYLLNRGDRSAQPETPYETEPLGSTVLQCFHDGPPARARTMIDFNRQTYEAIRRQAPARPKSKLPERLIAVFGGFPRMTPLYAKEVSPGKVVFRSETGIALPALLLQSPASRPKAVSIYLHPEGKQTAQRHPLVRALRQSGIHVLAVDLRGLGETGRYAGVPGYPDEFQCCTDSAGLGEPILGRRVWDVLRTVDYLRENSVTRSLPIFVYGEDFCGNIALLAAALDKRIHSVAASGAILSYRPAMQEFHDKSVLWNSDACALITKSARIHYSLFVPGILKVADLPEIFSLIPPRRVLAANPQSPENIPEIRERVPGMLIHERLAEPDLSREIAAWLTI